MSVKLSAFHVRLQPRLQPSLGPLTPHPLIKIHRGGSKLGRQKVTSRNSLRRLWHLLRRPPFSLRKRKNCSPRPRIEPQILHAQVRRPVNGANGTDAWWTRLGRTYLTDWLIFHSGPEGSGGHIAPRRLCQKKRHVWTKKPGKTSETKRGKKGTREREEEEAVIELLTIENLELVPRGQHGLWYYLV